MKEIKVLIVCGGGASSSFFASSMKKFAKKEGYNMSVMARSETEVAHFKKDIDVLLVGPHLAYLKDELESIVKDEDVKVALIDKEAYGMLDGTEGVKTVLRLLNEGENQ